MASVENKMLNKHFSFKAYKLKKNIIKELFI